MALKFILVVFLASLKYFLTIPTALLIGLEYEYAVVAIVLGGVLGFFFFYLLSSRLILLFRKIRKRTCQVLPVWFKSRVRCVCAYFSSPKARIIFTRRNRLIVKIKRSFGLWGIVITTPILLSIPVGAFLANYYYPGNKRIIYYMVISIVLWGTLLSGILLLFPRLIH